MEKNKRKVKENLKEKFKGDEIRFEAQFENAVEKQPTS